MCVIDFDYNVYMWGSNHWGQLGLGDNVDRCSPTIIEYLTNKKVEKIYCSENNTFVLIQNSKVYSWGSNLNGRLGIGNSQPINIPKEVNFLIGH